MVCVYVIGRIQVSGVCVCHWQDSGEWCVCVIGRIQVSVVCVIGRIQVSDVCVSLAGFR